MGGLKGQIEKEWLIGVVAPQDLLHSGWTENIFEGFKIFFVCLSKCMNQYNLYLAHLSI